MRRWWLWALIGWALYQRWEALLWVDSLAAAIDGREEVLLTDEALVAIWRRAYERLADAEESLASARQRLALHYARRRAGFRY